MPNTAGKYGGLLNGNLRYLSDHIKSELVRRNFKSKFEELNVTFAYPPMFVLPGVKGIEVGFMEYFDSLPTSRLSRRNNKIDVVLQAPEFSEHFDKKDSKKYNSLFKVEKQHQNLSEVDLARIVIEKLLGAINILKPKIKEDEFDFEVFEDILYSVKTDITTGFLTSLNSKQEANAYNKKVESALRNRKERKKVHKEKDKVIRDLRIYHQGFPKKALYPYSLQYSEIFLNLLRRKKFSCPTYHHIYIQVASSLNDALVNAISFEDWCEYGVAEMDFEEYRAQNEKEKENVVFNVISNGLRDIAEVDNLDMSIIEETINQIKETGLDTELVLKTVEHKNYRLTITYYSRSMEDKCPITFNLYEKETGKIYAAEIGKVEHSQIDLWLQKINLTNKHIKVKSSSSIRADVWLKGLPRELQFDMNKIKNEWKVMND
jgi:hypothetical protein